MQEGQLLRQIGISCVAQLGEHLLCKAFRAHQHSPGTSDNFLQKGQVALFGSYDALPVPLVDVGAVVMVQEVVLADGAHVGAHALVHLAPELLERHALPLGGRLHDLRIDGVLIVIVGNMERDRRARPIPVQHVIHAAFGVHDQRHLNHHQVEFFTEVIFDVPFYLKDRLLGFFLGQ